ncbi:MAG: endonuclease III domain-containing protein [Tepidiformaceae bacterium]
MARFPNGRLAKALGESETHYGALPLGNKPDPLDELFFIVLTTMTQYGPMEVFDRLKLRFPSWDGLLKRGAEANLREVIAVCGLVNQKAPQMLAIARKLKADFGRVTLDPLLELPDDQAEAYLLSLPRVGKKVARCVMMYSLGRAVLPVDAHVLRVSKRVGLLPHTTSWPRAHDAIHDVVSPELRFQLHVGLVTHGREVCTYRNPRCGDCILKREALCPGI